MKKVLLPLLPVFCCFNSLFAQWNYLPNAPNAQGAQRFDDIWFVSDSLGWAVNGDGKIFRTSDAGNSWLLQLHNNYYFRSVEFLNADTGFAGTLDEAFYETTDGGGNWHRIDSLFPTDVPGICGMGHWENKVVGVGIWDYPAFVMLSEDAGATWSFHDMSAMADALIDVKMFSKDTIFVSGQGTDSAGHHAIVLLSTDGGNTWQQVAMGSSSETYGWKLSFPSRKTGYASEEEFLGSSSHILKTTDGGNTWQELYVTNTNINMEGIGFINDSLGWLGGWSDGLYETADGGATWTYLNFGKNFNRYFFLNNHFGYAAGKTIYQYSNAIPTGAFAANADESLNTLMVLPNPVINNAALQVHLFTNTMVKLDVYNQQGTRMASFADAPLPQGDYHFLWKGAAVAPEGIYYAVLRTNENFVTIPFVIASKGSR